MIYDKVGVGNVLEVIKTCIDKLKTEDILVSGIIVPNPMVVFNIKTL